MPAGYKTSTALQISKWNSKQQRLIKIICTITWILQTVSRIINLVQDSGAIQWALGKHEALLMFLPEKGCTVQLVVSWVTA